MTARVVIATAALFISSPMAFAQAVVPGYDKPVSQVEPSLFTHASRGTPAGANADPSAATSRSSKTTGRSERREKWGD